MAQSNHITYRYALIYIFIGMLFSLQGCNMAYGLIIRLNELDVKFEPVINDEPLRPKFKISLHSGILFRKNFPLSQIGLIQFNKLNDDGSNELVWEIVTSKNSEKLDYLEVTYAQKSLNYGERFTAKELTVGKKYEIFFIVQHQVAVKRFIMLGDKNWEFID